MKGYADGGQLGSASATSRTTGALYSSTCHIRSCIYASCPRSLPAQPGLQALLQALQGAMPVQSLGLVCSMSAFLAQEILNHDAPAAVEVLMEAAEAADDTPFRERVLAHGAVFSNPTDSGCAAQRAASICYMIDGHIA